MEVSKSTQKLKAFVNELMDKKIIKDLYDFQLILEGGKIEKIDGKFIKYLPNGEEVDSAKLGDLRSKFNKHYNSNGNVSAEYAIQIETSFNVDAKYFISDAIEISNNVLEEYKSLSVRCVELEKRLERIEKKSKEDEDEITKIFKDECKVIINEILKIITEYDILAHDTKDFIIEFRDQKLAKIIDDNLKYSILLLKKYYNNEIVKALGILDDSLSNFDEIKAFKGLKKLNEIKYELEKEKNIVNITKIFNNHLKKIIPMLDDPYYDLWSRNDDIIEEMHENGTLKEENYDQYNNVFAKNEIIAYIPLYLCNLLKNYYNSISNFYDKEGVFFYINNEFQKQLINEIKASYYDQGEFKIASSPYTLENIFIINLNVIFNDDYLFKLLEDNRENSKELLEESERIIKKYNVKKENA